MTPLCPTCGVRPQFQMSNGRWRGACHECWSARRREPVEDGAHRLNSRGHWEVGVGGRWVNEARHLAELAGAKLGPDVRVRQRGDRIEVAVWQAVDQVSVVNGDRAGRGGSGDPHPTGTRRKRQGVFVDLSDEADEWVTKMAATGGRSRAQVIRDVLYWYVGAHP